LGILLGALAAVAVLVWVVGVVYSNPYSRGTACRETDSGFDCVKPNRVVWNRSDRSGTTNP
jgi:hypothetical protein